MHLLPDPSLPLIKVKLILTSIGDWQCCPIVLLHSTLQFVIVKKTHVVPVILNSEAQDVDTLPGLLGTGILFFFFVWYLAPVISHFSLQVLINARYISKCSIRLWWINANILYFSDGRRYRIPYLQRACLQMCFAAYSYSGEVFSQHGDEEEHIE
jgi:hypothetical protein